MAHKKPKTFALLLHITGPDRPGITAMLTKHLAQAHYQMLTMGQYVTHGLLSLSILVRAKDLSNESNSFSEVLKDILFDTKAIGLHCDFQIFDQDQETPNARVNPSHEEWSLTLVDEKEISMDLLAAISGYLAAEKINIYRIDHPAVESRHKVLEILLHIPEHQAPYEIKSKLLSMGHKHQCDLSFVKNDIFRFHKRLIVFDMDSTLTEGEVIDELAKLCGKSKEVEEITKAAMNGKIDFTTSLKERVALLKGLPVNQVELVKKNMVFSKGAKEVISTIKQLGMKTAVVSGGFRPFVDHVKKELGLDYAFGNELEVDQMGHLTGVVTGRIIDAFAKAEILETLAQAESIHLQQVVAVGDGSNDLKMLTKAGLGIAFHAKDVVKNNTSSHLSFGPMTNLLTFLGLPQII